MKILFACSEFYPLISTGDLADFGAVYCDTLSNLSHDIRVILPAYPKAVNQALPVEEVAHLNLTSSAEEVRLLQSTQKHSGIRIYLVDAPGLFGHYGHPYLDGQGNQRHDNALRFALFAQAVVSLAVNRAGLGWQPDVVHCNDWQTGLVPALLNQEWNRPATLFNLHQASGDGEFGSSVFASLSLAPDFNSEQGILFEEKISFLKAGMRFSDTVVCSSPRFAQNMENNGTALPCIDALAPDSDRFECIASGIDNERWNPVNDIHIKQPYNEETLQLKKTNKTFLQEKVGLPQNDAMLIAVQAQFSDEKHADEIFAGFEKLLAQYDLQLVFNQTSNLYQQQLQSFQQQFPDQVAIQKPEDGSLQHYLIAGADAMLFPLQTQLDSLKHAYCLKYGTVPIAEDHLHSSSFIQDSSTDNLMQGRANGYLFDGQRNNLVQTMEKACKYFERPGPWWKKLAITGMKNTYGWTESSQKYLDRYQFAIDNPVPNRF